MKISAAARIALRSAFTAHPRWNDIRKQNNLSLATMTTDSYKMVAALLGLDIEAICAKANNEPRDTAKVTIRVNDDHARAAREASRAHEAASVFSDEDNANSGITREERASITREAEKDNKAAALFRAAAEIAANSIDENDVRRIVSECLEGFEATSGGIHTIRMENAEWEQKEIKGRFHPEFPDLLVTCKSRDVNGYVPNCWIAGPAGSGKTFAARKIAEAFDLPFHFNGAIGMAHELTGFVDGNGCYHRTAFREAFEHGGVYLFDEVDGSDNAAILPMNAALANGVCTFPDGMVERHKDCIIIAAANTWGGGATADYVGRAKIDAAFLDRFGAKFYWGYDDELEQAICGNPEFAKRVQRARARAAALGLKVVISPRASITGAALIAAGMSSDKAAARTYLANLTAEQKQMIERE